MWGRVRLRQRPAETCMEELRSQRREKEMALRKARREQHLISRRLVRDILEQEKPDGTAFAAESLSQFQVDQLLKDVQHGPERLKSLTLLRKCLQFKEGPQNFIRIPSSMRTLVGLFTGNMADNRLEAARCLHELSQSDDPSVSEACIPATSYLLTYLSGHSVVLAELCLYTLGNLAIMSEGVRRKLLAQGVIPALLLSIQSPDGAVVEAVGYALSQLLQAKEASEKIVPLVLESGLLQHVLRLIQPNLELGLGAAVEFAWCLHYIICSKVNNVLVLSQDAVQTLVKLLVDTASSVSRDTAQGLELLLLVFQLLCPVLRCLGNLLAEDEAGQVQIQDGRLLGAIFVFMKIFLQQHPFVVPECLWLLNNLTADDPVFCSALLHWDLLPALLQLLSVSKEVNLLVLTVLCNIAEKGPAYCQQLRHRHTLPALITTLQLRDLEVAGQGLEFLHLLLRHCSEAAGDFVNQSGLQALEQYQDKQELQHKIRVIIGQCVLSSIFV
ncbi:transmembrane and coiled-coil domain-containing protein 6 isoform X1 [Pleurodeles waltl]|uniref:transmembrane and coiled-coil domain-containing protein 6 isoform X1 n=1 Tax=Pleurodeles waltl TaxID=8319 RepID=UPI00370958E1